MAYLDVIILLETPELEALETVEALEEELTALAPDTVVPV